MSPKRGRHGGHGTLAVLVGSEPPVVAVHHDPRGSSSGFDLIFADAPRERLPEPDECAAVCLHCLIEEHPEVGRGIDLARVHGWAERDAGGEWRGVPAPLVEAHGSQ